ncbi:protein phosphatase 1, regulatory subunit 13Bb isoform X2 [Stegostoma tigrinum]|uniref:protein phosphatase 1, regulatory subunit 13Bb isoform X2 n=1 Tax=Stegostoma tigrinum TaxID=3053191 RepID=UPI00202B0A6D|nr:protein phosphatase 1, regulatory subunit 13Bb isoform X2 [Stegostoma tigrinum]
MTNFVAIVLHSLVKSRENFWLCKKVVQKLHIRNKNNYKHGKMILTVYLSNNEQGLTEVPITPETTCKDVIEFCKEPGEIGCHLAEVWRGNERAIPSDHMMYEHLQKWGPRREEVKFFLRHEDSPNENIEQSGHQSQDQLNRWNGIHLSTDKRFENGGGNPRVELTLSELQEMASRQQHQIEAQQQMLVAKEQRLRYLKQQERRQQQSISESEKLQKLKERMESQEAKLKRIRAMRGQVDYSKIINGNLSTEIEHINNMFHEKQRELQSAVLKVDQLTQQLDDLRKGKTNGLQSFNGQVPGPAAVELKKLYQELQLRNKLNQEQNTKLQHQKELLNKRNVEVTMMDKRISELRERLWKKKSDARQKENIPLNRINGSPTMPAHSNTSGRVAAVGPYIQVSTATRSESNQSSPSEILKPQSLTISSNGGYVMTKAKSDELLRHKLTCVMSGLDVGLDSGSSLHLKNYESRFFAHDGNWPTLPQGSANTGKSPTTTNNDWKESNMDTVLKPGAGSSQTLPTSSAISNNEKMVGIESGKVTTSVPNAIKQLTQSYGPHPKSSLIAIGSTNSLERVKEGTQPRPSMGSVSNITSANWQRAIQSSQPASTFQASASQQIQQRITVPPSPTYQPAASPLFSAGDSRPDPPLAVAVRPFLTDKGSRPQSPRKGPQTVNSSSIYSMYLQQSTPPKNYQQATYNTLNKAHTVKAMYGKPVLSSGSGSASPSPLPFTHTSPFQSSPPQTTGENQTTNEKDLEHENLPSTNSNVENIPRPLSPTKLLPIVHSPLRYQSDADLEALRKKMAHAPRPLKKRSSITEPEGPSGPNIQKLLYQRFNTLAGGMDNMPFYLPSNQQDYVGALADVDNGNTSLVESGSVQSEPTTQPDVQPSSDANDNQLPSPKHSELIQTDNNEIPATIEDNNNNPAVVQTEQLPSPLPEIISPEGDVPPQPAVPLQPPIKRTNLKKPDSERTGCGMRVKFDPLALLLDASLEGEFDLVQRIIYEVNDPSRPNDEGITPLHNAVCAGHHHIVKFLVDFGVNANAADSDGWTPLHCAASCNSVQLCKLLVESGAAIFATTISDVETAADKCEEMEEGFVQCSQFLYGVQEKMGVMNKGVVYALWDYEAKNSDELSFHEGDPLTIVRRKDDNETDWWWARLNDKEGYVPRNLLGLYPRIKPRQRTLA